jgi:iron(III) transport system ATP-binding protein
VANFVGTINLVPGHVKRTSDGGSAFESTLLGRIPLARASAVEGEAEIAIRPHSLMLADAPDGSSHVWLPAAILEREFLGEFVRYMVKVREERLTVDQAHHVGHSVYEPGQQVHVRVDAAQLRVLPK